MKVYFVRHGETAFNKAGKVMGQLDEPLDADGIRQSHELAEKIDRDFQRLFCSPLQRARQTAEILNEKLHLEIEIRGELHERDFGSLAGKTLAEMNKQTEDAIAKKDEANEYDYRPYGGESAEDVKARINRFLDFLRQDHADHKVLVVTHTGIIRLLYLICLGRTYPPIANDSVHEFEI